MCAENPEMLQTDLHSHSSPGEFTAPVSVFLDRAGLKAPNGGVCEMGDAVILCLYTANADLVTLTPNAWIYGIGQTSIFKSVLSE